MTRQIILFFILAVFIVCYLPLPSYSATRALWLFDEGKGNTVLDGSGNNNTGILKGGPKWMNDTPFKKGFALSFDGVDDYVEVPDHPSLNVTEGLTLEAWIKPPVNASVAFLIKGGQDLKKGSYLLYITGGFELETDLHVGGEWQWTPTATKLKADEWQHVAMTWDGSTMRAYINGEEIFSTSIKGKLDTTKDHFYIGYTPPNVGGGGQFKGLIDEVRISDVALKPSELGFHGPLEPEVIECMGKLSTTWGSLKGENEGARRGW